MHWFLAAIHVQVSTLAVAGPALVILAELARVLGLSCTCERITRRSLEVAIMLEEVKTGLEDEKDVKVGLPILELNKLFFVINCWIFSSNHVSGM